MIGVRDKIPSWLLELPLLSVAALVMWILVGSSVMLGYRSLLTEASEMHHKAARLAIREPLIEVSARHMPVVRAIDPQFENDTVLEFMRSKPKKSASYSPQQDFEAHAERAQSALDRHPYRVMGVVPARFQPHTLLTTNLVHPGVVALFASLILFLLAAPILEALWGTRLLALSIPILGVAGAGAYQLAHWSSDNALLGSASILAGLVAAVVVRFKDEHIDFFRWLSPIAKVELFAPAWSLAIAWVAYEAILHFAIPGSLPTGIDNAVGYTAHAAAAVTGASMALAIEKLGWEQRGTANARQNAGVVVKQKTIKPLDLKKIEEMRAAGDEDGAFVLLEDEVRKNARNRNAVVTYWNMALDRDLAEDAAPVLHRLLQEELRRGAKSMAAKLWRRTADNAPKVLLDPPTLLALAPAIGQEEGEEGVALALRQAIDKDNTKLTPQLAAQIARMAVEVDPRIATRAAKRALQADGLEAKTRAEMEMLIQAMAPSKPGDDEPGKAKKQEETPAPCVFFEESDRSAFGEVGDISALLDEAFPDGAISEGIPTGAGGEGLRVQLDGQGETTITFLRIRAIAVVGIHGLAPKPVVVFDLVVDGCGTELPLSVIRLRCDRFDPRTIVPNTETPKDALRALVQGILKHADARCLANLTAQSEGPKPIFESLDDYHDKVLRPIAPHFA